MVFGIDDIVFILISTSVLIWAKRGDVVSHFSRRHQAEQDDPETAYLHRAYSTTPLLLPGFDLSSDVQHKKYADVPYPLIQESFSTALVPEYNPCVPHRQYNAHKRVPPVSSLTTSSEKEVSRCIKRYSPAQVSTLFTDLEREGCWESALSISKGIGLAGETLRYLTQVNVEKAIRTLLDAHKSEKALDYYFEFGADILLSDDLLVMLFDSCRGSKEKSMKMLHLLIPFQRRWNEVVYACCLTVAAEYNPSQALTLYQAYTAFQEEEKSKESKPLMRFLSSSALLQESGVVRERPMSKLQFLYHIIVPLVAENYPKELQRYVSDMMRNDRDAAPDVFLKCLLCNKGRYAIESYAREYVERYHPEVDYSEAATLSQLALQLYTIRPSPMNMNSLLGLLMVLENEASPRQAIQNTTIAHVQKFLDEVPLTNTHARILCRTITESNASWQLASAFTSSMLQREQLTVIPTMSRYLSRSGRWSAVAMIMSVYMSHKRNRFTRAEIEICVNACVNSGRWKSALFWVQRASGIGLKLPSEVYDAALSTSPHVSWQETKKLMDSISSVGGKWSNNGALSLTESCVKKGRMKELLKKTTPLNPSPAHTEKEEK